MGSRGRRRGVVSQHSGCGLFYATFPHIDIFVLANIKVIILKLDNGLHYF